MRWVRTLVVAFLVAACTPAPLPDTQPRGDADDPLFNKTFWPKLETFADAAAIEAYLDEVRAETERDIALAYEAQASAMSGLLSASGAPAAAEYRVRGVTNVQSAGVDEGDIVKLIDRFLIVLQDGRLFSIDLGAGPGALKLADRVNVYRNTREDTWYDEVLVEGRRIVVIGYSYGERASEYSLFTLGADGALTHDATYYIGSDDYYDPENYSARLVDGKLALYMPYYLMRLEDNEPLKAPLVRRWLREERGRAVLSEGAPLFDFSRVYRPVQKSRYPTLHTLALCPLTPGERTLSCSATSVIGSGQRQLYVAGENAYLWLSEYGDPRDCMIGGNEPQGGAPAVLVQAPLSGDAPRALITRGAPRDQFNMAESGGVFYALLQWNGHSCGSSWGDFRMRFFSAPLAAFAATPQEASAARYVPVPDPAAPDYRARFTDRYLVYAGAAYHGGLPDGANATGKAFALPLAHPDQPVTVPTPHQVIRIERVGARIVLTGYGDQKGGLSVSLLDLSAAPRITATQRLAGRFETEGRSHAFNYEVGADGAGMLGVPTMLRRDGDEYAPWRTDTSDVSYLSVTSEGALASLGALKGEGKPARGYKCEVSCVDWYGNSRPLFIGSRVFALSGTELVEGAVRNGAIAEAGRLNLTTPLPRRAAH